MGNLKKIRCLTVACAILVGSSVAGCRGGGGGYGGGGDDGGAGLVFAILGAVLVLAAEYSEPIEEDRAETEGAQNLTRSFQREDSTTSHSSDNYMHALSNHLICEHVNSADSDYLEEAERRGLDCSVGARNSDQSDTSTAESTEISSKLIANIFSRMEDDFVCQHSSHPEARNEAKHRGLSCGSTPGTPSPRASIARVGSENPDPKTLRRRWCYDQRLRYVYEHHRCLLQDEEISAERARELGPNPTRPKEKPKIHISGMDEIYIAKKPANVREKPDLGSRIVASIKSGSFVNVIGKVKNKAWYLIERAGERLGYVFTALLEPKKAKTVDPIVIDPVAVKAKPKTGNSSVTASGDRRVALVIGNGKYRYTQNLSNPSRDATAIAEKLRALKFEVTLVLDADKQSMERALRAHGDSLRGSSIALTYFAGHGMQIDGKNFLIPTDARLRKKRDVNYEVVALETVLFEMEGGNRANIVILDACRNNPLAQQLASQTRSPGKSRGLAIPLNTSVGTLIAYATAPNREAVDGKSKHSPYTTALLKWLGTPGMEIAEVFRRVREDVMRATERQQIPWENSSLVGGGIYLATSKNSKSAQGSDS